MDPKLAAMREDYRLNGLHEADVASDPVTQFQRWFDDALKGDVYEPNGMTLATVDADGQPTARIVLLKMIDQRGSFLLHQYGEQKRPASRRQSEGGADILVGVPLERQVRFEGTISEVDADEADTYYQSRPIGSRIGAWASPQSQVIESREVLEKAEQDYLEKFGEDDIPRPPSWGGYRLSPARAEFWQGRSNRLHDRLCYRQADGQWLIERLAP